jgi:hypothetical protein
VALERWERFAPFTGIAAVLFWVLGVVIVESGDTPGDDATAAALVLLIPPIGWAALIIAFPLWVVLVSVLLYRRGSRRAEQAAT